MAFDFMGKIKEAKNDSMLDMELLAKKIEEIGKTYAKPLQVKVILSEKEPKRDLLVKASIFVSSMPSSYTEDLYKAIAAFRYYLEEIARIVNGQVSRSEGFYNNEKTFNSLY